MPVMDGATMLAKLRGDPELKDTPVIMLTAESGQDNVARIASLGISDYVVKPFKDEVLLEKALKVIALSPLAVAA